MKWHVTIADVTMRWTQSLGWIGLQKMNPWRCLNCIDFRTGDRRVDRTETATTDA